VSEVATVVAHLALIWGALLLWLAIGAVIRRAALQRRFAGRGAVDPSALAGRRVLMTRPCAGAEAKLLDNLRSVAALDTRAVLRVVMTIDDPDDGARPIIEAVVAELRAAGVEAELAVLSPTGPNRKASMIAATLADADYEVLVNVDSNVDLRGFPLDALLAPLFDPEQHIGATWSPWSEQQTHAGVGPRASAAVLGASLTAFPLLCGLYGAGLVGKIFAARREAIEACEFGDLTHYLGEDLEMANRMLRAGWKIAPVPVLGRTRTGAPSFAAVVTRFGRWMLAARGQRPELIMTYPLFFFATPMVLTLATIGLTTRPRLALIGAALAVVARLLVALAAQYWSARPLGLGRALVEAVLGDLALGLAWIKAMTRREVVWRGHRLRVEPSGRLAAVEAPALGRHERG